MMVATAATRPRVAAAEALLLRHKSGSRHTGCGQTAATIEYEKHEVGFWKVAIECALYTIEDALHVISGDAQTKGMYYT